MVQVFADFARIARDRTAAHIDRLCRMRGQWSVRSGTLGECALDMPLILAFCRFSFSMFYALMVDSLVTGEVAHFLFDFLYEDDNEGQILRSNFDKRQILGALRIPTVLNL